MRSEAETRSCQKWGQAALAIVLVALVGGPAWGQVAARIESAGTAMGSAIREIADPHSGDRWLLERDPAHAGGPGRLVRIASGGSGFPAAALKPNRSAMSRTSAQCESAIHAGERVVLEEDTSLVEARLEGTALSAACAGSAVKVRLAIGGRTVRAVALAPGRAALAPQSGERR